MNKVADLKNIDLDAATAVELRKLAASIGIKGASKGRKAELLPSLKAEKAAQLEDAAEYAKPVEVAKAEPVAATPKKGICEDCGRRVGKSGHPTLCTPCWEYASAENTHSDDGHEIAKEDGCPVCFPELDPRTPVKPGRSRAGMVIIAKGTEIHKSETFRVAAEAAGWSVNVVGTVVTQEDEDGEEFEIERYVAIATRGEDIIDLSWDGRAYDYPHSYAKMSGKVRKVRNLKEALRFLAR